MRLVASPQFPELNGLTFPEIAAIRGRDEWDCFFDLLVAAGPEATRMFMYGELYTEEHLQAMVGHPLFMLAVDAMNSTTAGPLAEQTYQPLVYSGQIYHLTHHVLETGLLRLEEAIRKMTSMPASHFGLRGRGLLQPGFTADVVVMDVRRLKAIGDARGAGGLRGRDRARDRERRVRAGWRGAHRDAAGPEPAADLTSTRSCAGRRVHVACNRYPAARVAALQSAGTATIWPQERRRSSDGGTDHHPEAIRPEGGRGQESARRDQAHVRSARGGRVSRRWSSGRRSTAVTTSS